MKIVVQADGYEMVLDDDMFEQFSLSVPSDITRVGIDGGWAETELGHTHIALTGMFKEGVRPEWRKIDG